MATPLQSEMLRLFQTGAATYQPDGLAAETGDPRVALENLHRLLADSRLIIDALTRPSGTLFIFSTGEQFYTPALRVGQQGDDTEVLAEIAAEAGFGEVEDIFEFYSSLPTEFEGRLPLREIALVDRLDEKDRAENLQAAPNPHPSSGK